MTGDEATGAAHFPVAPWHLRGWGVATFQTIDVGAARAFVPSDCAIVAVAPGKTLGGLLFLSYESGSSLVYHELNVVTALVRIGKRIAFHLPRLYVDNAASLAGGRAIWGLPKEPAEFDVAIAGAQRTIRVTAASGEVCRMRVAPGLPKICLPFIAPAAALGMTAERFLFVRGFARALIRPVRTTVDIRAGSEFAQLHLDRHGYSFSLSALRLNVHAPAIFLRASAFPQRQ